jgi:hypothetical protein
VCDGTHVSRKHFNDQQVCTFFLTARGKVTLYYSIAPPRESCYIITKCSGSLAPKEERDIKVGFLPVTIGRFSAGVLIECRGISFKEVFFTGIGAMMKLDVTPEVVNLGRCSYNLKTSHVITLKNSGDVTVYASFNQQKIGPNDPCVIYCPDDVEVKPRETVKCPYLVEVVEIGKFQSVISIVTKEKIYTVPVTGVGIKINLSSKSLMILESEELINVCLLSYFV